MNKICKDLLLNTLNAQNLEEVINIINNTHINNNVSLIIGLYYNKILYNLKEKNIVNYINQKFQKSYKLDDFIFNKIHKKQYEEYYLKYYLFPEETKLESFNLYNQNRK